MYVDIYVRDAAGFMVVSGILFLLLSQIYIPFCYKY